MRLRYIFFFFLLTAGARAYGQRIVSTDGTISEILVALGLESRLVGVDVTSTYPSTLQKLPRIGHNRNINAEGILALKPDVVTVSSKGMVNPAVTEQLKTAGRKVIVFDQEYSPEGAKKLIREVGAAFNAGPAAGRLARKLDQELRQIKAPKTPKKILFVYARGSGTLLVAGQGTAVDQMIRLTGHRNAAQGFRDFKTLTSESLVTANPDVVLMLDTGLESLGGINGALDIPGFRMTNAGRNRKVITMDGILLMGFGPRLGLALTELSAKAAE